ncbi:MAG: hypothetical protein IKK45_02635 [Akkermansia sp.]|nr:hypothetical protein [Akkermansia sp.]
MYIPTQEERYSKVARLTLLLCVIIPSGIVAWLADVGDLLSCLCAFLWPIALPLDYAGFNQVAALCISALVQGIAFFALAATHRLSAKTKLTIAITWGMLFALLLRILIAYAVWQSVLNAPAS